MPNDIELSVGTRLYVSVGAPATHDIAGFEAKSWTEVGEIQNIGEFGGSAQVSQFIPLNTGIVKKRKGSIDYGTAALQVGRLIGDAGQALLKDGFDGAEKNTVHSFKVVTADNDVAYFTGVVASFVSAVGDANTVAMVSCNVELDNKVMTSMYGTIYTLTYAAGANGSIIGPTLQKVASGDNGQPVYAAPATGYAFSAWSDAHPNNPRTDTNVVANKSVTATFVVSP